MSDAPTNIRAFQADAVLELTWGDEGVGYQELIVGSTFGDDVTLQILDSLVPLRC